MVNLVGTEAVPRNETVHGFEGHEHGVARRVPAPQGQRLDRAAEVGIGPRRAAADGRGTTAVTPMVEERRRTGERLLLRWGAGAAIVGTVLQVAAGTGQSALLGTTNVSLDSLAELADWVWPAAYLGFIVGALLWVGALAALAATLTDGAAWALGRLAVVTAIVGATLHVVDGALNVGGLAGLADAWAVAPEEARAALSQDGELLRRILEGTWAGVVILFHGVPFVLAGLAVALSRRYPAWLGWVGVGGGAGSLVVGVAMFFGALGAGPAVPFAVVLSLFMVAVGSLMWIEANAGVVTPATP